MAFHCPNCNGSMVFDIASQQMKCVHCESTCDPQTYVMRDTGIDQGPAGDEDGGMAVFTCQNCGAELEGTEDSMIGFCPYCGGQSMVMRRGSSCDVEDIIPFKVDKDRCMELYGEYVRHVRYLPKELRDPSFIQKFTGIYLPFYQYDLQFDESSLTGTKTVEHHSSYDIVNHYRIDATVPDEHERGVTFDASRYLDDEISDRVQPFDTTLEQPFHPAYLAGFYADTSTVPASIYEKDAVERAGDDFVQIVQKELGESDGIAVSESKKGVHARLLRHHPVLFPLWFLTWRKDDRVTYAVINGESGKVVSDLPLDLRSFAVGSVVMSVIIFLVLEFLFQPTPLVTSLISLAAALVMAIGIRAAALQEYEKQQHTNDKGWAGEDARKDDEDEEAPRRKRRKPALKLSDGKKLGLGTILVLAYVLFMLVGGLISANSSSGTMRFMRIGLPAIALATCLFVATRVLAWHKQTNDKHSLFAIATLLVTVILNTIVVFVSPVNDGWYYIGDAVCIVGLVASAIGMIRAYNVGTTRPLPKLFDRAEVEQ